MKLQIETYHGCNARCTMCTIDRWTRPKGPMDDALFKRIASQALGLLPELEVISLYMDGEPLLDKGISRRVAHCKEIGLPHVGFSSNASLLTREDSRSLLDVGMNWIAISLDSMDAESYEKVRRRLDHATVVANVHALIEEREKSGSDMEIALRFLGHPENRQTFEEYEAYWQQYLRPTDKIVNSWLHNWGETPDGKAVPSTVPCFHLFRNMVVLSNGKVPMCCVDYNAENCMGQVEEQTLAEIWNGEKFRALRDIHSSGKRAEIDRCRWCTVTNQFERNV